MLRKSLITVLLVAIGIFAFGTAQAAQVDGLANNAGPASPTAIFVNPGGLGDALIYGYYNARGSLNFIRVVNTATQTGVGVKVRFREGEDSIEVLDFYICLSSGDQWTAWVTDLVGTAAVGNIVWYDNDTPTFPDPQGDNDVTNNLLASVPFSTAGGTAVTPDDTKEGYFEMIGVSAWADPLPGVNKVVKTPQACGEQLGLPNANDTTFTPVARIDVPNVLAGTSTIFNLNDDAFGAYAYNATALANFRNTIVVNPGLATDDPPRLSDATEGLVAVNFVLTKSLEFALYDLENILDGETIIINTFPTKRLSIELDPLPNANGPFNDAAVIDATTGAIGNAAARCETVGVRIWDDAENTPGATVGFSPGQQQQVQKCDEVSLFILGTSGAPLMNTTLDQANTPVVPAAFELGRIDIDFTTVLGRTTTIGSVGTTGLPVISYGLQGFLNSPLTQMLPLMYTTTINGLLQPTTP